MRLRSLRQVACVANLFTARARILSQVADPHIRWLVPQSVPSLRSLISLGAAYIATEHASGPLQTTDLNLG